VRGLNATERLLLLVLKELQEKGVLELCRLGVVLSRLAALRLVRHVHQVVLLCIGA